MADYALANGAFSEKTVAISDLHCSLSRWYPSTKEHSRSEMESNRQTDRPTYRNLRCTCMPRVNNYTIFTFERSQSTNSNPHIIARGILMRGISSYAQLPFSLLCAACVAHLNDTHITISYIFPEQVIVFLGDESEED